MNTIQYLSVAIIGGADGPTSIYVTKDGFLQIILSCCLFGFAIFGFVWSIKKKSKVRTVIYGAVIFLFMVYCSVCAVTALMKLAESRKHINSIMNSENTRKGIVDADYEGYNVEADDYEYFSMNDIMISVYKGFAGTGFVIENETAAGQYKGKKVIFGSGVAVIAEDSFIGTVDGNILRLSDEEYFVLENHVLRYFCGGDEYEIYNIDKAVIEYPSMSASMSATPE